MSQLDLLAVLVRKGQDGDPDAFSVLADRLAERGDSAEIRHALMLAAGLIGPGADMTLHKAYLALPICPEKRALNRVAKRLSALSGNGWGCTLAELCRNYTAIDVLSWRACGPMTLRDLRSYLSRHGLSLKGDVP